MVLQITMEVGKQWLESGKPPRGLSGEAGRNAVRGYFLRVCYVGGELEGRDIGVAQGLQYDI